MTSRRILVLAITVIGVLALIAVVVVGGILFMRSRIQPEPPDPQTVAYEALKAASAFPPDLYFENGFPRGVHVDVTVAGGTPVERATNFLNTYKDLYLQSDPNVGLGVRRSFQAAGDQVT